MTIDALLIGPSLQGGEDVYMRTLSAHPPADVHYELAGTFHQHAPGARCQVAREVLLNRVVRPATVPDLGFRALKLERQFDLVHVHAHPVLLRGRDGVPLVMSEGSSSAVYLGDYLGWDHERIDRGYRRARRIYRALGIADRLLAQEQAASVYVFSEWARSVNVGWGADPDKTEVIEPGFPTPPERHRGSREQFRFLFIGTDFERKGGFDVVEAFSEVVSEAPTARLTLIAPDPAIPNPDRRFHGWANPARRTRGLERLSRLVASGSVDLRAPASRERLYAECYPEADAFVMPTHAEGLGFTNIEAMGFGLPVISSTVGPVPDVVSDGVSGRLISPGDAGALADVMLALVRDPGAAWEMGAAGRRTFLERFTLERFRAALADLYGRVLEHR